MIIDVQRCSGEVKQTQNCFFSIILICSHLRVDLEHCTMCTNEIIASTVFFLWLISLQIIWSFTPNIC